LACEFNWIFHFKLRLNFVAAWWVCGMFSC